MTARVLVSLLLISPLGVYAATTGDGSFQLWGFVLLASILVVVLLGAMVATVSVVLDPFFDRWRRAAIRRKLARQSTRRVER